MSNSELGAFLHARRGQVQPGDVGLPVQTSRRVPGLRREEVAMLAGVSVDYYTRLEQGRERNPSPSVLNALATALCLDADQRQHAFRLAELAPVAATPVRHAAPDALIELLEAWPHTPAMVISHQLDVLAHNALTAALYADFERVDNLARMTFLDPAATRFHLEWDRAAEATVANLRLALGHVESADSVRQLVVELCAGSAQFRRLWATHDVRGKTHDSKRFSHRDVGDLTLDYHAFEVRGSAGWQLVVYHAPAGSPSAEKLTLLASLHAAPVRDARGMPSAPPEG
ncbi:helix-turn-helix domain-containing protein [Bogoriella caseilytica]|uniref:Helix-turn-helix protein n=1 Tax=Bogoriella caseilytica TaxID=56055 RepID=A0A3N2BAQ9_9MICO|nr:helix-turn-helix transcriptional regulator [Bogoriella caseilytica]ROR72360.1 helix-turn-helix protein [Bogoriella caseilytica]